ncbi:butyrate--CoA ligase AAE11, peroxisomal-like protein [Tanacetum coccineum]
MCAYAKQLLRKYMYMCISDHKVTHMCCAPVVLNILIEAKPHERREITAKINILTGGAPPPAALLETMEDLGFHVMHAYGLTEATALVCEWQTKWNQLPKDNQARLKARQGVSILTLADVDVRNKDMMVSVPHDGITTGEILLRGSSIMKGYLKDEKETARAFQKGWFWTGDVGVIHTDGYIEIKDRSKDVIISGGENISSVEIESILFKHPAILETAVVAMPHPRWGESPCAFVVLKKSGSTTESEILDIA